MSEEAAEAVAEATWKRFRRGTHRLLDPEETVRRMMRVMPVMGITRIANVTGLDSIGVPVVMVCRPNARSLAVSQGKGLTLAAAKASGLMETIELYHAESITSPLKLASWNELCSTHRLADVMALPRLSVSRFHGDLRLLWIVGHDLLGDAPTWVPFEMVHTNYTLPLPTGSGSFVMSSNGLASGNHVLEAISHAICEVIERDATTLWQLRSDRKDRTRIDLGTVDDPGCREVLERFDGAGVEVAAWETTTDVGIPAFFCAIAQRTPDLLRPLQPAAGAGCHPSRGIALLRALTEAAQSRLTNIAGSRDDMSLYAYRDAQNLDLQRRTLAWMKAGPGGRRFDNGPTYEGDTFAEDVAWELARLDAAGIEQVVMVDLTKPEFRIPVVRVVIPGLEPIGDVPGYTPGARARRILEQMS